MHGVVKFDPRTGVQQKGKPKTGSYTNYFADALIAEAERDNRIVAIHAAMAGGTGEAVIPGTQQGAAWPGWRQLVNRGQTPGGGSCMTASNLTVAYFLVCGVCSNCQVALHPGVTDMQADSRYAGGRRGKVLAYYNRAELDSKGTFVDCSAGCCLFAGLYRFEKRFPQRIFDVGIAEQHAVTFAAGMACEGMIPMTTIYSSFLQRGYDQVVHDVALQNLPGKAWGCVVCCGGPGECFVSS